MSYPRVKHFLAAATAPLHTGKCTDSGLPALPAPKKSDRVVFFSPHPDDETIFAGGFLADAVTAGATVHVVLVTDGDKRGHHGERIAEFQKATRLLGIKPQNLTYYLFPDGELTDHEGVLEAQVRGSLEKLQPTLVLAPHPADSHIDHATLGVFIERNVKKAQLLQYLGHYPPHFPWPRRHLPNHALCPPKALASESWYAYAINKDTQAVRARALSAYERELRTPTLRSLMLACDRTNELFVVSKRKK